MTRRVLASGIRVGELELISPAPERPGYWRCRCSCGDECVRSVAGLRRPVADQARCKACTDRRHKTLRLTRQPHRRTVVIQVTRLRAEHDPSIPTPDHWRPQTRGDCASVPRPCPYVGCAHHLALNVNSRSGTLTLHHVGADGEPDLASMADTCALDVADRVARDELEPTHDAIGHLLDISRQAVEFTSRTSVGVLETNHLLRELAEGVA